jgi:hypothetical protein
MHLGSATASGEIIVDRTSDLAPDRAICAGAGC